MNAEITAENRDDLLVLKVRGLMGPDDIAEGVTTFYPRHDFTDVIWDFRETDLTGLSPASFERLADLSAQYAGDRGSAPKTAGLVNQENEVMLVSLLSDFVKNNSPVAFFAAKTEAEVMAWLGR